MFLYLLKNKINVIALTSCLTLSVFWIDLLTKKYYAQDPGGWDTALHANTLWHMIHGSLYNSFLGASFLAEHCTFLSFLVAPMYWLHPDPLILQHLKVISFFVAAYLFFLILNKNVHPFLALGGMLAFCLAPANIGMLLFAFNYEPFCIPLIFFIYKSFDDNRYVHFLVGCFLLAMVKEQMPLVVMMFGVFALIFRREQKMKWGLVPLVMGIIIFIVEIFVIIPLARKGLPSTEFYYWGRYAQFGNSPGQIISFLLTHPPELWHSFFNGINIRWFKELFDVWGILSALSPHILLLALPLFIKNLLSGWSQEHSVTGYYYAATFTPFIFLAAWNTLNYIKNQWRLPIQLIALGGMFIHAFIFFPLWSMTRYPIGGGPANVYAMHHLVKKIPPQASVISGDFTLPLLANRFEAYQFDSYLWGNCQISGARFILDKPADYLLLNFAEYYQLLHSDNRQRFIPKITEVNFGDRWQLEESIEDLALFTRSTRHGTTPQLIERSRNPFKDFTEGEISSDGAIRLEGLDYPKQWAVSSRIFPMTFYWQAQEAKDEVYRVLLSIQSKDQIVYTKLRPIGSVIYPVNFWQKKEHVKETYNYLLPNLDPGEYSIEIAVYQEKGDRHLFLMKKKVPVTFV